MPILPPQRVIRATPRLLSRHRLDRLAFGGFPDDFRPRNEAEAYEIQNVLHKLLADAGRGQVEAYQFYQDWTSGRLPRMLIVVTDHATPTTTIPMASTPRTPDLTAMR